MSENLNVPNAVFNSGLSPRARLLWLDFTNLAVENYLFPSQAVFAKDYGCSKTTIGRAIKELIRAGLLIDAGQRDKQRRKKYGLNKPSSLRLRVHEAGSNPDLIAASPEAPRNGEYLHPEIATEEQYLESLPVNLQIDYVFGKYGPEWFEQLRDKFDDMAHLRRKIAFFLMEGGGLRKTSKMDVKSWVESCLKPKRE